MTLAPQEKRALLAELLRARAHRALTEERWIEEASLYAHRRLFPALSDKGYFNYGARGPTARPALEAIRDALEEAETIGPFSRKALVMFERSAETLRGTVAAMFSVAPDAVVLTDSTTTACNVVLWGIDWRPGDRLLLSDSEHLSAIAVAQELRDRFGVEVRVFRAADAGTSDFVIEALDHELGAGTRLVLVSHVLWNTGAVMPLARIRQLARERTAGRCRVLVDGAQAAGLLDVTGPHDFYALPASKWCCGPAGVGALVIGSDAADALRPTFGGWRGAVVSEPDGAVRWRPDARRHEGGLPSEALYCGWNAALHVPGEWGDAGRRIKRALEMARTVWRRFVSMRERGELPAGAVSPDPPDAGIVTLRVPDPATVARRLEDEHVYVRSIPYPESVRICTHYLTSHADVERLVDTLARVRGTTWTS